MSLLLGAAPMSKPRRIMSLDLCDDLRLLMLVPRERIASVTYLTHPAAQALLPPGTDTGVAINHGAAEEILRQRPDLIVGAPFAVAGARRLARQVGARVLELPNAEDFATAAADLRTLGAAVGEPARAERLVRNMDATLARLGATRPVRRWRVVAWGGGDAVPGKGTLTDAIITAAGAENIAARNTDARGASFDLEQLLAARPDAVMRGVGPYAQPSLHQGSARHPLIARLFAGHEIDYPEATTQCGIPQSADTAVAIRRALERLPAGSARW